MSNDEGDASTPLGEAAAVTLPPTDAVEEALAEALRAATAAGRWDVVAQVATELAARRQARAGNVVSLRVRRRSST